VIAWKFLAPGAIGPFSRVPWPTPAGAGPGTWVNAAVHPCASGIHACEAGDLPYWLHVELWEVELEGPVQRAGHKVVAPRGRLTRRIDAWDRDARRDFCEDCETRVRGYASRSDAAGEYLEDLAGDVSGCHAATAGDDASRAATAAGGSALRDTERVAQVRFLVSRLELGDGR
jgi:hypothetical protein